MWTNVHNLDKYEPRALNGQVQDIVHLYMIPDQAWDLIESIQNQIRSGLPAVILSFPGILSSPVDEEEDEIEELPK